MTALDIINYALDRLGAQPAASLSDTGRNARVAIRNYDLVRDKVLRLYEWPSLIKRAALEAAEVDGTAVDGLPKYPYAFDLPTDCFRVIECSNEGIPVDFRLEGRILYLKIDTADIKYIKVSTDPSEWDALLQSAVGLLLASEISDAVTGNDSKKVPLYQEFMQVVSTATGVNNVEATAAVEGGFTWVD